MHTLKTILLKRLIRMPKAIKHSKRCYKNMIQISKVPFMDSNSSEETCTPLAVWNSSRKKLKGSNGSASDALFSLPLVGLWALWLWVALGFLFLAFLGLFGGRCLRFLLGFLREASEDLSAFSKPPFFLGF